MKPAKKSLLPHLPKGGIREIWKEFNQKEARERALEPRRLRIITFILTFISMSLGLSFIPLFPQPLPILISFMVAAVTYGYPQAGMPIGCGVIGLGLIYQLSTMNFISMISYDSTVRAVVIVVWLVLFIVPPIVYHRQKAALAIDLGLLAAMTLFFNQTYFLAVPLILTSWVLFKRKSGLTVLYTILIFVPLLLMQYLNTILQIVRTDWWLDPAAVPAVYLPLSGIFKDLQTSMLQFRLYDTNKIVTTITDQLYLTANPTRLTIMDALKQYRDSLPGIMLFLAIVATLVLAIFLIVKTLLQNSGDRLLPIITATSAAALFFICLSALQIPLAISGKIDSLTAAGAVFATLAFTLPPSLISYQPKKTASNDMILEKTKELLGRLQTFEENLNTVKTNIPVDVTSVDGKMVIIKDKLTDIFNKAMAGYFEASEVDRKFDELEKGLSVDVDSLFSELDLLLREFHTLVNCEYSSWVTRLKAVGLNVESTVKTAFQNDLPLESRIERIKELLDLGRLLANRILPEVEQIYTIMRSLYDPNLPEESGAISFAKEKLDEKTPPWVAIDTLLVSLNNWRRQYSADILSSVERLKASLSYIVKMKSRVESLSPALEAADYARIVALTKAAESIEVGLEQKAVNVTEVTLISNIFQSSLDISRGILLMLNQELLNKENAIESLLPTADYMWEKNITLKERMASAVETVTNPSKYGLKQTLENLPRFLANLDECVATIVLYHERKELLLNYPKAETAIENQLSEKLQVSARDLPFESKYSEEFLRLFYSHKYPAFSFDEQNMVLAKKT
ncbi:hypothetical protein E2P42_03120 [Candidatus Bathyarchaeota archaeon]|nr:hypothetical protein E2P42_03120 [Candidatus Bathyarchaeota archaeon]